MYPQPPEAHDPETKQKHGTSLAFRNLSARRFLLGVAAFVVLPLLLGEQANSQSPPAKTKQPSKSKPAAADRVAVPAAAQLKLVQEKIQALYGPDLDKAKKPADKAALATTILKTATDSADDPGAYYALLTLTRELALGGGNVQLALDATNLLVEKFELDAQQETYTLLKKYTDTPDANVAGMLEAANASFNLAKEAAGRDDYAMALKFSSLAQAAATKSRSAAMLKQVAAFAKELTAREAESAVIPAAKEKLAADPNDPAANLTLGRWHWFRKQDPAAAMPYLAKTVESPLKKAALAELEKPTTPDAQLALADQWWALSAVVKEELVKERLLVRAADWYQAALPESKGFDKIKAERRIAEISKLVEPLAPKVVISITQPAANTAQKTVRTSLGAELIYIPPGKFVMGSPENEPKRRSNENQVEVEITRGFYLGKYEVTQREWKALMGTEPWKENGKVKEFVKAADDVPACYLQHGVGPKGEIVPDSATDFCKKLSAKEGKTYRLPTEAEWEYACRAGTKSMYHFGDNAALLSEYAWFVKNSNQQIHPVGLKKPNPWGLYDMHGNANELCLDLFNLKKANLVGGRDPVGTVNDYNKSRSMRSGSFQYPEDVLRSGHRGMTTHGTTDSDYGFRLVLEADEPKPDVAATTTPATTLPPATAPAGLAQKTVRTSLGADLIYIPPGKFLMGSPETEPGRQSNEKQVPVEITRGFYLGKYEVTQREWKELMGTEPWKDSTTGKLRNLVQEGDNYAACCISHGEAPDGQVDPGSAADFCKKLSQKEGKTFRLPTEAEWEYACRAGSQTVYSFGDNPNELGDYAWHRTNSRNLLQQVGKKKPNAWGLHDMHGNALEWCRDSYSRQQPELLGGRDPLGSITDSDKYRVARGGSFNSLEGTPRVAMRYVNMYKARDFLFGFRLVLEADEPKPAAPATTPATSAATPPAAPAQKTIQTSLGSELLYIPPGKFLMGSPANEPGHQANENQVQVEITRGFYLGKHEVTQGEWKALMKTEPWKDQGKLLNGVQEGDNVAASCIRQGVGFTEKIDPDSAVEFCKKLSKKEGKTYRLPTEAEWEYACRAGTLTAYSFGNNATELGDYAWMQGNTNNRIQQVGTKKPNPWGLHDMYGNVDEWCQDSYNNQKPTLLGGSDPVLLPKGDIVRILRGGNWSSNAELCRSARRHFDVSHSRANGHGLRIVLEADEPKPDAAATTPAIPPAEMPAADPAQKTIQTSLGSELLYIPPGKFLMGSPENEPDRRPYENQVQVEITRGFYIGKYEVTQGEWKTLMGTEPWKENGKPRENIKEGDDIVAVHIPHGWNFQGQMDPDSAMAFCKKLSQKEGRVYRLPTEAEWEYACRAGTQTTYYFGDDASKLRDYAWYQKNSKFSIHQVGEKKPNAWGLYDMLGNAQEWCLDSHSAEKPNLLGGRDPLDTAPSTHQFRVSRGGNFGGVLEPFFRSAYRAWYPYNASRNAHGFRLVLEAASVKPGAAAPAPGASVPAITVPAATTPATTLPPAALPAAANVRKTDPPPAGAILDSEYTPESLPKRQTLVVAKRLTCAQTFTVNTSGTIVRIEVPLKYSGVAPKEPVQFDIRAIREKLPASGKNPADFLTRASLTADYIPKDWPDWVAVNVPPVRVAKGEQFALVLSSDAEHYNWSGDFSWRGFQNPDGKYDGGQAFTRSTAEPVSPGHKTPANQWGEIFLYNNPNMDIGGGAKADFGFRIWIVPK